MMAAWMLYALMVAAAMGLAGLVAERLARLLGRPQRWAWVASLAASLLLPVVLPVWSALTPARVASGVAGPISVAGSAAPLGAGHVGVDMAALAEAVLTWGWVAASGAGVLLLLGSALSLRRRRRRWEPLIIDGIPVLISRRTGPAVVGLLRCTIVLPEWVLDWPAEQRRLIVTHEREHTRARDPLLVGAALAALALAPWNLALWWQARRLQLAIEVDCDRRVLHAEADVGEYASLLLEVGRRASGAWLPVPAFSEPVSLLERRIRNMTAGRPRHVAVQAALLALLLLVFPLAVGAAPVVSHPSLLRVGGWLAGGAPESEPRPVPDITLPTTATFGRGGAHVMLFSQPSDSGNPTMPLPKPRARVLARMPLTVVAACAVASCQLDRPVNPGTLSRPQSLVATMAAPLQDTIGFAYELAVLEKQPSLANARDIRTIMQSLYPPLIRQAGIGGTVQSQFVIEADGAVRRESIKVLESPNEQLSAATAQAITNFRFNPGLYQGKAVRVLIQMPVTWEPEYSPVGAAASDGRVQIR
jgi:TonB family protein